MIRPYPERNPFPYQGTSSIEGTRLESAPSDQTRPTTLMLDPVERTLRLAGIYLRDFAPGQNPHGLAVALRGEHGSGKTHVIRYVMGEVAAGYPYSQQEIQATTEIQQASEKPLQIYVKAEGPDFLAVYRRVMAQIPIDLLRDLSLRFLGVVAGEQFQKDLPDREDSTRVAEKLRSNPEYLSELFREYLVEEGAVQEQQSKEIAEITEHRRDFQRAFYAMSNAELATTAYNWLLGQEISADDTRKIGVCGPITSTDVVKVALQLVFTLFNRVGRPLMLYIDQYEKLVLAQDAMVANQNMGLLQRLVEVVPREKGMFLIAGNMEAWQRLPIDLKMRFGHNIVTFPVLTLPEAKDLIRLYLTATTRHLPTGSQQQSGSQGVSSQGSEDEERLTDIESAQLEDPEDLYPFTVGAVREVVRYSSGNIRRLLQMCSTIFDAAFAERAMIEAELVYEILPKTGRKPLDEQTVAKEIERLLSERSLRFQRDFIVPEAVIDFAILDRKGSARLLIEITQALFHHDEALHALRTVDLVEQINRLESPPPFALIVLGYASPEVTETLRTSVHELVVYNPDTFHTRFGEFLDRLPATETAEAAPREEQDLMEHQLAEVRSALEKMAVSRESEAKTFEYRLAELLRRQASDRFAERRENARQAWADERRRIEERVQEFRSERRTRELAELERLRAQAESERTQQVLIRATWMGLYLLMLGGILSALSPLFDRVFSMGPAIYWVLRGGWTFGLMLVVTVVGPYFLRELHILGSDLKRQLSAAVGSAEDLERLARLAATGPDRELKRLTNRSTEPAAHWLLRHPNPQFRYAGALIAQPDQDLEILVSALGAERSSLVRRVLARRIAKSENLNRVLMQDQDMSDSVPEVAYIVEAAAQRSLLPHNWEFLLPHPLRMLAVIAGAEPTINDDNLALELAATVQGNYPTATATVKALAEAFDAGVDRASSLALSEVSVTQIHEAIQELSPFEGRGLGTFDELRTINKIDQFYLFFRQVSFFMERGLFATPSEGDDSRFSRRSHIPTKETKLLRH